MRGGLISANDVKMRPRRTVFLEVEGESERVYFTRLARMSDKVSVICKVSKDKNCVDMVNNCVRDSAIKGLEEDDIKVVVFDIDVVKEEDLVEAMRIASENGILIAASNLSFELWLLMHLEDVHKIDTLDGYEDRISQIIGREYRKSVGLKDRINQSSVEEVIGRGWRYSVTATRGRNTCM